ncbi:hypothetical protein DPEC_G00223920 [Dallia pectoralis]|uniref:Uncharacterized protein n=1 Tax=Dallia pectoralis TaxID=75939 RepID=A0ACC2G050_DALPE|nr:hypothetical protein DPEC_G00223920 [Dallia pectoralis]
MTTPPSGYADEKQRPTQQPKGYAAEVRAQVLCSAFISWAGQSAPLIKLIRAALSPVWLGAPSWDTPSLATPRGSRMGWGGGRCEEDCFPLDLPSSPGATNGLSHYNRAAPSSPGQVWKSSGEKATELQ